ncbi:MAG: MobA/MobL family protein [Devosia sp.]
MKRSAGHSTIQRLAYIARLRLDVTSGQPGFNYSDRSAPASVATLLPDGASPDLRDGVALWTLVESASARHNAVLGLDMLMALPAPQEMREADAIELARRFLCETFVEMHGLAVTFSVHRPHGGLSGEDLRLENGELDDSFDRSMRMSVLNAHCHALITPRQAGPEGLSRWRYTALDPSIRGGRAAGINWGRLWHRYQNRYFAEQGLRLRVTPNPPFSLTPIPILDAHRRRKRQLKRDPQTAGRRLIVNRTRDRKNRQELETIAGALACFDAPFTGGELRNLLKRQMPNVLAGEMTEAVLGLGETVRLAPLYLDSEWFAPLGLACTEIGAFGRSLMLTSRRTPMPNLDGVFDEGFSSSTRRVLIEVFREADLVIVNASCTTKTLMQDLAEGAKMIGRLAVTILTAAGSPPPPSVTVGVDELKTRMVSNAIILVDEPDALTSTELDVLMQASIAGCNRLILMRQVNSRWGRSTLLDLIADHARVLEWPEPESHDPPVLAKTTDIEIALEGLQQASRIAFEGSREAVLGSALGTLLGPSDNARQRGLVMPNGRFRRALENVLHKHQNFAQVTSFAAQNQAETLIVPVISETIGTIGRLFSAGNADKLSLVVDRSIATDLKTLREAIQASVQPNTAICTPLFDPPSVSLKDRQRWPLWAVDPNGEVVTTASAIRRAIAFWSTAPIDLIWRADQWDEWADHQRLDKLLAAWGTGPTATASIPPPNISEAMAHLSAPTERGIGLLEELTSEVEALESLDESLSPGNEDGDIFAR